MLQTVKQIVQERRASSALGTINDLLDRMLTVVGRQSGEKLDDINIIAQCITFLIAGHETTSGLLSFALGMVLGHPSARHGTWRSPFPRASPTRLGTTWASCRGTASIR